MKHLIFAGIIALAGFGVQAKANAFSLGTAQNFAVLGNSTVTNTGLSVISGGNLGLSPGTSVTGFPPGIVQAPGTINVADAVALQAQNDNVTAYNSLLALPANQDLTGQNLGGLTLLPGVYSFSSSAQLTGILTLNNLGDPNALFVFQIGSTLATTSGSSVLLSNGDNPNTFFLVGSSATLGTATQFKGNILARTSITLDTGANIQCGRALAQNGAVTLDTNNISTTCETAVVPEPFTILGTITAAGFGVAFKKRKKDSNKV